MTNRADRTQEVQALRREKAELEKEYKNLEREKTFQENKQAAIRQANDGTLTSGEIAELTAALAKIEADIGLIQEKMESNLERQREIVDRLYELGPIHDVPLDVIVAGVSKSGMELTGTVGTPSEVNSPNARRRGLPWPRSINASGTARKAQNIPLDPLDRNIFDQPALKHDALSTSKVAG